MNNENDFVEKRMEICKECGLYKENAFGWAECNSRLFLNPKTNEISSKPKDGYFKGCGCRLSFKQSNPFNHCPLNKW